MKDQAAVKESATHGYRVFIGEGAIAALV